MMELQTSGPVCCGIELSARRAIFVFLRREGAATVDITGKNTQVSIEDEDDPEQVRRFYHATHAVFERMRPDRIAIIQRKKRGHFASGGTTFKLEGLLQLYPRVAVTLVAPVILRQFAKEHRPDLIPRYRYQKNAYLLASYLLHECERAAG